MCDDIINVMDFVSTKITNTISINVTSTMLTNSYKKVHCYILHTVLLVIVLLLIIAFICYHYAKHWSKQKGIDALTI